MLIIFTVFFAVIFLLFLPFRLHGKTYFALEKYLLYQQISVAKNILSVSLTLKLEDGKMYLNGNRLMHKSNKKSKEIKLLDLFNFPMFPIEKVHILVHLGNTENAARAALCSGIITTIFTLIKNTNGVFGQKLSTKTIWTNEVNRLEAQIVLELKLNIFLIIIFALQILKLEVRK